MYPQVPFKRRLSYGGTPYPKRRFVPGNNQGVIGTQTGLTGGQDTLVTHRTARRANPNSFRQKVLQQEPTKHFNATQQQAAFVNNTIYNINVTAGVTVGATDITRVGDAIDIMALKVKGHFANDTTTPAQVFRILVGWSGEEVGSGTFATTLTASDIFLSSTGTSWVTDGIINPKAFTVLHDQTMDQISPSTSTVNVNSFAFTVPINQKFVYQGLGAVYGKFKNLFIVVMGNNTVATVEDIGLAFVSYDLIYK